MNLQETFRETFPDVTSVHGHGPDSAMLEWEGRTLVCTWIDGGSPDAPDRVMVGIYTTTEWESGEADVGQDFYVPTAEAALEFVEWFIEWAEPVENWIVQGMIDAGQWFGTQEPALRYADGWRPESALRESLQDMVSIVFDPEVSDADAQAAALTIVEIVSPETLQEIEPWQP